MPTKYGTTNIANSHSQITIKKQRKVQYLTNMGEKLEKHYEKT